MRDKKYYEEKTKKYQARLEELGGEKKKAENFIKQADAEIQRLVGRLQEIGEQLEEDKRDAEKTGEVSKEADPQGGGEEGMADVSDISDEEGKG